MRAIPNKMTGLLIMEDQGITCPKCFCICPRPVLPKMPAKQELVGPLYAKQVHDECQVEYTVMKTDRGLMGMGRGTHFGWSDDKFLLYMEMIRSAVHADDA